MIRSIDANGHRGDVRIEANCFIGGGSLILPGVTVGPNSIVGAGAVVYEDVPPFSIAVGNPARIIASNVQDIGEFGRLAEANINQVDYYAHEE
ncbi:MAG: DapH/DapD/GlmU-related protein [Erythrobacter sp.]